MGAGGEILGYLIQTVISLFMLAVLLRFLLLCRAALDLCRALEWSPDIIHCHDWHTALIPVYLKTVYSWDSLFSDTRTVLTLHNIGYQGVFGAGILSEIGLADSVVAGDLGRVGPRPTT